MTVVVAKRMSQLNASHGVCGSCRKGDTETCETVWKREYCSTLAAWFCQENVSITYIWALTAWFFCCIHRMNFLVEKFLDATWKMLDVIQIKIYAQIKITKYYKLNLRTDQKPIASTNLLIYWSQIYNFNIFNDFLYLFCIELTTFFLNFQLNSLQTHFWCFKKEDNRAIRRNTISWQLQH